MKKTIYLLSLLGLILTCKDVNAQAPNIVVNPQSQCYSASGNTATAYLSPGVPGAVNYSWTVVSPNCSAGVTTFSNGNIAFIAYPCCGVFTITAYAFSSTTLISTVTQTAAVNCSGGFITTNLIPGIICSGNSATLTASGATSYTWSNGIIGSSIVVSPSVSTCYTVMGYNSSGCLSSAVRCATIGTAPVISVSGNTVVCAGSGATLTASGASTYTWYTSQGTFTGSTIVLTPTATSCYSLIASSIAGCMGYSGGCVTVSTITPNPVISSNNFNICAGSSATLFASGASTYTWFPMGTVASSIVVSPTATTCYTLVGYSCFNQASTVRCVTVGTSPVLSISGNTAICAGSGATLTASGASTYTWYTSQGTFTGSTIVLTPSATTCYSLVGSNGPNCNGYSGGCVSVSPLPNPVISSSNFNICAGSSATLFASGASTYTWFPMGTVASSIIVSPTATTCYTLVGYSCFNIASAIRCVTVGTSPVLSISGNTAICTGSGATLTASGASTYTWYTSQGTFTGSTIVLTPSATTCYSLVGSNGPNCNGYSGGCVTVGTMPVLSVSGNTVICAGSGATLTASGASTYTWYTSQGTFTGSTIVLSPSATACYSLVGSNGPNCIGYSGGCITVQTGSNISITGPNSVCSGSYIVLYATGGSSLTWMPGGSHSSSIIVTPTASGCYTLTGIGCSGVSTAVKCFSVLPSPIVSVSGNTAICAGSGATLTASGASTYTWMTSQGTFTGTTIVLSPSATTCYSLMGNNSLGCPGFTGACISVQNGSLSVSGNTIICSGSSTTLTASGAQTYTWSNGMIGSSIVVSPTASACYTVVGYSSSGCGLMYRTICVYVNPKPILYTASGSFCAGQSGTLAAFGANTYTWQPFNLTGSIIGITPSVGGCYTVTGTSTSGCTNSVVACYSVFPAPTLSVSGPNVACYGSPTTLVATGAQSYTWAPGGTTGPALAITPTASTCYTVTSNYFGCISSAVKCLSVQTGPTVTVSGINSMCAGSTTTLIANGASSYTWLPGNLTGPIVAVTPTASTCYTVVGTNSNGCVGLGYKCLQLVPKPTITTSSGFFCAGSSGTLQASGASTYTWLPYNLTGSSIVITPSVGGCYTVIGSNSSGCTNSVIGCFSVIPAPSIFVTGNGTICAGATTTLIAGGASSYTWLPGGLSGANIVVSPSVSTCYTVIGSNGICTSAVVKCVIVQSGGQLNISGTSMLCSGASANLLASGAATYTWNTGSNSPFITVTPTASTCYTVLGTTSSGCIGFAVKCISVQPSPIVTISGPASVCQGAGATLVASGASSYVWNTGSTSSAISVPTSTSAIYSVTGSNGICSSTKSFTLIVKQRPSVFVFRTDSVFNDSTICAGDLVHLAATGAHTYSWSGAGIIGGLTSPYVTVAPNVTTTYTVVGTNSITGCSNAAVITIFVSPCTGVAKNSGANLQIGMYPNPSSGKVTLQGNGINTINYAVYDVIGRQLVTGQFTDSKTLDLSGYANGTYIIRFESGSASSYQKLILEK